MKKEKVFLLLIPFLLVGCGQQDSPEYNESPFHSEITFKTLTKEEYYNKTLGGLLGQFAGFFSGYEFAGRWKSDYALGGLPLDWFEFCNGPYAGNVPNKDGFIPTGWYAEDGRGDRLRNGPTGIPEVWCDDDYHLDIFNQLIMDEYGFTSYAIKEAWKDYQVADWGGGSDAMKLIFGFDMLAPYSGSIEAENTLSWCTEAYIENETIGFNCPGMPQAAQELVDKFASNVGYYDSLNWAKFYAAMYSMAYFESDVLKLMEKARCVFPKGSYPDKMYDLAFEAYELYPNNHVEAAHLIAANARNIYLMDDPETNCNVNGAFAILSLLYGKNDYIESCKYSSVMGFDGDCTAAIVTALMGIINGFKDTKEEYEVINNKIYYNGEGLYRNEQLTNYPARIRNYEKYPEYQKITDIVKLYQKNFEKVLLCRGGAIFDSYYKIPCDTLWEDHSKLFFNYDAEECDEDDEPLIKGFKVSNGLLENVYYTDNEIAQSGNGAFVFTNENKGNCYHTFNMLNEGHYYRLSTYVTNSEDSSVKMYAKDGDKETFVTCASQGELVNRDLIFKATSSSMNVGFKFDHKAISDEEYIVFDSFQLEEIERIKLDDYQNNDFIEYEDSFYKVLNKPANVKIGEEVTVSIEYNNPTGHKIYSKLLRNNKKYGGVVFSMTALEEESGRGVIEIPYVFESDQDILKISFPDDTMSFGGCGIYKQTIYMFR